MVSAVDLRPNRVRARSCGRRDEMVDFQSALVVDERIDIRHTAAVSQDVPYQRQHGLLGRAFHVRLLLSLRIGFLQLHHQRCDLLFTAVIGDNAVVSDRVNKLRLLMFPLCGSGSRPSSLSSAPVDSSASRCASFREPVFGRLLDNQSGLHPGYARRSGGR